MTKAKIVKTIFLDRGLANKGIDFRMHIDAIAPFIDTIFSCVLSAIGNARAISQSSAC